MKPNTTEGGVERRQTGLAVSRQVFFSHLHVVVVFRVSQSRRGKPQAAAILDDGAAGY